MTYDLLLVAVGIVVIVVLLRLLTRRARLTKLSTRQDCPNCVSVDEAPTVAAVAAAAQEASGALPAPVIEEPEVRPASAYKFRGSMLQDALVQRNSTMLESAPMLINGGSCQHCSSLQDVEDATAGRSVMLFFATGCGPCERFKPVFEEASMKASLPFYAVDAMGVPDVVSRYQLRGFPTVRMFQNGRVVSEYNGDRTMDDLLAWAQ